MAEKDCSPRHAAGFGDFEEWFANLGIPASLNTSKKDGRASVIAISGSCGGAGKSLVAVNLASAYASTGLKAALVDLSFGSIPLSSTLGVTEVKSSLRDFISGKAASISKILTQTSAERLFFVDNGIGRLNFTDKGLRLKKNLIKRLSRLEVDVVILDLGQLADHISFDYFHLADHSLLVVEPSPGGEEMAVKLAADLYLRSVEAEFRGSAQAKKAVAAMRGRSNKDNGPLAAAMEKAMGANSDVLERLRAIKAGTALKFFVNKARDREDIEFGLRLRDNIASRTGVEAVYAGAAALDESLRRFPPEPSDSSIRSSRDSFMICSAHLASGKGISAESPAMDRLAGILETARDNNGGAPEPDGQASLRGKVAQSLEEHFERKKSELIQRVEAEVNAVRAKLKKDLESEKRNGSDKMSKDMADVYGRRLAMLEGAILSEKDRRMSAVAEEIAAERARRLAGIDGEIEETKRLRLTSFEKEMASMRLNAAAEVERYKDLQRVASEKEIDDLAGRLRKEAHTNARREVDKVREVVWQELEEERNRKILSIKDEARRLYEAERDNAIAEAAGLKNRLKEEAGAEAAELHREMVEEAHHEIMRLSAFFDTEQARTAAEASGRLGRKLSIERDRLYNKLQNELAALRQAGSQEMLKQIGQERSARLEEIGREIEDIRDKARVEAGAAARAEAQTVRDNLARAIAAREEDIKREIELKRGSMTLDMEKEVMEFRARRFDEVRGEVEELYERLTSELGARLKAEEREKLAIVEQTLDSIKREREAAMESLFAEERKLRMEELSRETARLRRESEEKLSQELYDIRRDWAEKTEAELSSARASGLKMVEREVAAERERRISELSGILREDERALKEAFAVRMAEEEKAARERLVNQLEMERRQVAAELAAEMRPRMMRTEMEFKDRIEERKTQALETLRRDMENIRARHVEKIIKWEREEKGRRLAFIEARILEEETVAREMMKNRLAAEYETAAGRMKSTLERRRKSSLETLSGELERRKEEIAARVRRELETEREKLRAAMTGDISGARERGIKSLSLELAEERDRMRKEMQMGMDHERIELRREMSTQMAEEKAGRMDALENEIGVAGKAFEKRLEERGKREWRKKEEWLRYEASRLKLELKEKMGAELEAERSSRRRSFEEKLSKEADDTLRRARLEAEFEKGRLEQRYRSEFDLKRAKAQKILDAEYGARMEDMEARLKSGMEAERKARIEKLETELEDVRREKALRLEKQMALEKAKLLDILGMEIKTEEYKRRQELIAGIMQKKAELDISFQKEKESYFERLKDELWRDAQLNRERFDEEIGRIAKSLRLN
ncbi:MAG: hypothetical protein HZB29_11745 [Nitrospinae bacterium]|nr:hypothetical protein [Nitrospinota bacterium]